MPTAVERLAGLLKDIFSLNVIESPAAQAEFRYLESRLDAGVAALNGATSRSAFAAAERQFGHGFEEMGAGTFVLGAELRRDAAALNVVGHAAIGGASSDIFGGGGGSGRGLFGVLVSDIFGGGGGSGDIYGGGGGSGAQADLSVLTRDLSKAGGDLETFGVDFAHLGQVRTHEGLAAVEARFHPDLVRLQDDFLALGGEAAKLTRDLGAEWGGGGGSGDQANLLRGLSTFESEFGKIGDQFGKLADIYGGGGGSGTNANGGPSTDIFGGGGGSGFAALHESFATLDSSLSGLARPLAGLLLPAVHPVG